MCVTAGINGFEESSSTADPFAIFAFAPIELYFWFDELLFEVRTIVELVVFIEVHAGIVLIAGGVQTYKQRGFIVELMGELVVETPIAFNGSAADGIRFCAGEHEVVIELTLMKNPEAAA